MNSFTRCCLCSGKSPIRLSACHDALLPSLVVPDVELAAEWNCLAAAASLCRFLETLASALPSWQSVRHPVGRRDKRSASLKEYLSCSSSNRILSCEALLLSDRDL